MDLWEEIDETTFVSRFLNETDKVEGAEESIIGITKNTDEQKHDQVTTFAKIDKLAEEIKGVKLKTRAAEKAEDTRAFFDWCTTTKNRFKDVIHNLDNTYAIIQRENDHLQEQLQIKDAEAQDQKKIIDHLKKKMVEVENKYDINAKSAEMFHRRRNYFQQQFYGTMVQSERENMTPQRTITNLQSNIRTLSKELKKSKKSVIKKEADKSTSQRALTQLQRNLRIISEELIDSWKRFSSVTDKLRGAEQKVIELTKNIDDQTKDKETASAKLDKLEKENEYLVNQLRSNENKMDLLNNSHETERKKHESAMKWIHARCSENEIELEKHKNAHFNLLLQLNRVHNYSRISMEETALFDKTFIEQKLEDERSKEEDLAEVTTNVIKKFASAKERHGVIKSFQKRIQKGSCPSPFGNDFLSDEDSHMEHVPTAIHEHKDNKQYNERLEESTTTKNCHNKTEKNTNVFNINMNIAKSNVSFIDKKEERTLCLNGGSSDNKAIEGKEQL